MAIYKLGDLLDPISETKKAVLPQLVINTGDVLKNNINPILEEEKVLGQFKKIARIDNILFSEIRPGNGRWALVKDDITNCLISTKMLVLRAKEIIIPEYAFYILTTVLINDIVQIAESRSGTFPQITFSNISHLKINLPTLKQQQEIIDIIKPIEDAINNLDKQIEEVKKILVKQYESLDNIRVGFSEYIELCSDKYSGQESYLATNAVGEFIVDILKEQNITEKRPSRANLTPVKNSIIISKLDGENKILYIDEKFNYVVSTGFFNFTSEYLDYVVGFLLSEDFKKQKTLLSTGTTMVGLNNVGLNKVLLTKPIDKDDKVVKFLNILIKNKLKLKEELDRLVLLLVK